MAEINSASRYSGVAPYPRELFHLDNSGVERVDFVLGRRFTTYTVAGSTKYVVMQGDTVFSISKQFYGTELYWWRILDVNPSIVNANVDLEVDSSILIPPLAFAASPP